MSSKISVSPTCKLCCCPLIAPLDSKDSAGDADEVVNLQEVAVLGDKIVGVEVVTHDEHGRGALAVNPLPSPQEPTPAERERHNVSGHIKYAVWCPICVACRRPNNQHRLMQHTDRELPPPGGGLCLH